jgi:energy-coupling factor transporter ATP-binding protein EcfA2
MAAGKSTLFKSIMGFVPLANAGKVEILGHAARDAGVDAETLVAYVPQSRGGRLELSGSGGGRRDDGPLRPHELPAHDVPPVDDEHG